MNTKKYSSVDEYHSSFPAEVTFLLSRIRKTIQEAAPKSKEVIAYNMPAFKQKRVLVYYAAYKKHIGFYPTAKPIEVFKKELQAYKTSKGAIQFPLDQKLPIELIKKMVRFRVKEEAECS